jgi:hypothetical protein
MSEIVRRIKRLIVQREAYCKLRYREDDVLTELDELARLRMALALLQG